MSRTATDRRVNTDPGNPMLVSALRGFDTVSKRKLRREDPLSLTELPELRDTRDRDPARVLETIEERGLLLRGLWSLSSEDYELLRQRFGLTSEGRTLAELGEVYSVTKEAIRLRVERALERLRESVGVIPPSLIRFRQARAEQIAKLRLFYKIKVANTDTGEVYMRTRKNRMRLEAEYRQRRFQTQSTRSV